ncbi:sensor histidine kinase [Paenibacillus piri]|uniref:histidine kinase n=1 Tax=Paenibacillus piri TaxID=2547395 RepID=A0A4R5KV86_9BACL|nr:sensor histidine kinase [Paenibacillus piri]TDF98860.1 HAMP domain-containing histidine kinase [Paenibacillus piri]
MRLSDFIMDRLLYIVIFLVNVLLVLLVIGLDFLSAGVQLKPGNMVYIFVLSLAGLSLFLILDFVSKRAYYRRLADLLRQQEEPDKTVMLNGAANREQRLVQDLMQARHRLYMDELTRYRQRQDYHRSFMNQWVHHMKTPVSVIGLLIQQFRETGAAANARELLESIEEENDRLYYGLDMILQMARLDQFELDVQVRRVDLNGLIRSVINDNKKACIRQAIYPKLESGEPQMEVETDEKWMRFVLNQLTVNAIKYSRTEPVGAAAELDAKRLMYTVERTAQGISVHVADEGIGIPEQDVPRVFDAFFTGDNGRLTSGSTGMGLFLAKQVCNRLGHRLTVSTREGGGSTFSVAFAGESIHKEVM